MNAKPIDIIRNTVYQGASFIDSVLNRQARIAVLCYHSISNDNWRYSVSLKSFEQQMKVLVHWGNPISYKDIYEYVTGKKELKEKSFLITFDDGYENIYSTKPLLNKLGIKPLVFVLSDPNNANRSVLNTNLTLLSPQKLKALGELWDIGCHSATHPVLTQCNKESLNKEIIGAKVQLEKIIGKPVSAFCYPKGMYNNQILELVAKSGYKVAFSMDDGSITNNTNKFAIPRIGVDGSHTLKEFKVLASPTVTAVRGTIKKIVGEIYA